MSDLAIALHWHRAHRYCFIAKTLADSIEINIL